MKPSCLSLFLLFIAFTFHACEEKDISEKNETNRDTQEKVSEAKITYLDEGASLLYEISGNGLDHPSYLYGTIHMIDEKLFSTGDQLEAILSQSDYLVMEVENIMQLSKMASVMTGLRLDSGVISDYVSDSLYRGFITALEENTEISETMFNKQYADMKPFGLYTLAAGGEGKNKGKTVSYELYFMDKAYHHNLQLAGLETIEDQMTVFDQISMEDMLTYMTKMLSSQETSAENEMEKLGRIYATKRLDSISNFLLKGDDMLMTKYKHDFLDQRNSNWIPVIEELCHQHHCFIAVGAAHLPGETGVIELLRNQGYTLKAVSVD
jgi:hypothetical protein